MFIGRDVYLLYRQYKIKMRDNDQLFEKLMDDYISGVISDGDRALLLALISESDIYKNQYKKIIRLHALLHIPMLESQKKSNYERLIQKHLSLFTGKKNYMNRFFYHNAAAIIILMISVSVSSVYVYKQLFEKDQVAYAETIVPLGSQTKIILPDSSVVVLNSGSILKYPLSFGEKERNVTLSGEAYFEVAKKKGTYFHVFTDDLKIRVTGTVFNVRSYPEDHAAEINLIEGGVDVSVDNKNVHLEPNQKAVYNQLSGQLMCMESDASKSAWWTTGKLNVVNSSFTDILKNIERRYNIKIDVESKRVEKEYFSGTINLNMTLQEVFDFIDVDKKYSFQSKGNNIILKDK